ncbi:vanomycin resistance protein VanB [Modestobacter sp. Leaf380]|nr:vanomycin resistance protein VanB [Modestobacter sp. Leaf380]
MQPDGTVGSARPGSPAAPPAVSPQRPVASVRPTPPSAPAPQLPLTPRRRARDEDAPPPVPVEQLPTSELATPSTRTPSARTTPAPDERPPVRDEEPSDLETTAEVPAAVVPRDVFDDVPPRSPASAAPQPPDEPEREDPTVVAAASSAWADSPAEPWPASGTEHEAVTGDTTDDGPGDPEDAGTSRSWWRRPAVLAPVGLLVLLGVVYGADLAVAGDDVPRNTVVAGVDVGGMSPAAAADTLTADLAPRVTADHVLVADDVQGTLSPATAGITLDVDATVQAASGQPLNPWTRVVSLFTDREVEPVITGDETALEAQLEQFAGQVDRAPSDATIALEGTEASVVPAVTGRELDRAGAAEAVTEALASGGDPATPIDLPVETTDVLVHEEQAQQALDETVTPALSAPVTVVGDDGATTAEIDEAGIASALVFTGQEDGTLAVTLDPAALSTALGDQLGEFGTPAVDADFAVSGSSISVVPSVDGTGIDPTALAGQLLPVLAQPAPRQVTASLGPVPAEFTTDEANALGVVEQISTFTTNFTSQASGTNIRVVAAEVDGALILPGEDFSLNGYTGPRGEAQGYVAAGVINNGEFTQAVGGGISQFATTMFNAVFFAGLEDVFHKPHSYYISRYPAGREATVYYDSIDLKWRNDSPTGVYVQTIWTSNSLTVTFWGTQRYDIESISSDRYNVRSPVVQEKPDDGSCSPQGGSNGFDITVTRVFKDPATGAQIRTEDFQTRYAAEPVIRCVPVAPPAPEGTAPAAPAQPTGRRPSRTVLPGVST